MKTCRVCGAYVDDREWNCPECGASMITSSGTLSLKATAPEKKRGGGGNRMGTTVSTGSGLTDILRAEDDEYGDSDYDYGFNGGSIPLSFSKNIIEEEEERKKAKKHRQLVSSIFKLVFLVAIVIAGYLYVTKVILKDRGANTYKDLVSIYVDAVNEDDQSLMLTIVPEFISYRSDEAAELVEELDGITINSFNIKNAEAISSTDIALLIDQIKLETGKNANINEGYILDVEFTGKGEDGINKKVATVMEVYRVKDKWFLYPMDFEAPVF
ncbi:MAG: hypothetical protein E7258_06815 [Lachnospiraceae bacterium]|nr:hypothetical protein [Lachnospiraceae bacterium]